jgi:hypothetical protein
MTYTEIIEGITKALGSWSDQTEIENKGGLFSKNRLTEDLLLPMFRIIFKSSGMKNLNTEKVNYDYIDLADSRKKISIQVTTERRAAKITETLKGFIDKEYHRKYERLIIFILDKREHKPQNRNKVEWKKICGRKLKFDPSSDIVTVLDLFPLIQGLSEQKVRKIHEVLSRSVFGAKFIDVARCLHGQASGQLNYEKESGKYIPNLFIESLEIKNLARCFAYPSFFVSRTIDSFNRLNIVGTNKYLGKMGLPKLPFSYTNDQKQLKKLINEKGTKPIVSEIDKSVSLLERFEKIRPNETPPFKISKANYPYYEQNVYHLSYMKYGLTRDLESISDELKIMDKQVFILTSRAGQGKTNFICDFVEKFLFKHEIPCAYLSGRKLSKMGMLDIGLAFNQLIFEDQVGTAQESIRLLVEHSKRLDKPCVLIIDGINEHHKLGEFSGRIESFIDLISKYPQIKLLLTCRSEFFQARFGDLIDPKLKRQTFLKEAHFRLFGDERYDKLIEGYFNYFILDSRLIDEPVINVLKKDILLLRFFCEAYGARDKDQKYKQPRICNIHREQIFKLYLDKKIKNAKQHIQTASNKTSARDPKHKLYAVLEYVLEHMLHEEKYTDVPITVVPSKLDAQLVAILDEELILRKDVPPDASVFSSVVETINFTFDEFRDFLLAQYLLKVFTTNQKNFEKFIRQNKPENSQIIEGIKRFLFYISRRPENNHFLSFYKDQKWYLDVYDDEIFNIEAAHHQDSDKELVTKAILKADYKSNWTVRQLAVNWNSDVNPVLNLGLLISIISKVDNNVYEELIVKNFIDHEHTKNPLSANAFCKFFTENILDDLKPGKDLSGDNLVRFLIILLPVNGSWNLDSQSYLILSSLIRDYPDYVLSLLRESLDYKITRLRPYIWRLATLVYKSIESSDKLISEAKKDQKNYKQDNALYREVSRFLKAFQS